ncbi:hypothetical protein L244_30905 [Salmonella enterica subsp. enterica serovar Worthington str. BCH-3194]|nr:hypothetical protein L245_04905 [Salmonella enterica subsp. enterica serovar Worthington str. BCH-4719]KAF0657077.1 hypothetical protein L247_40155 [Salmonella enterica subsp. enterica serovar Worthington str. BCH-7253]KAF0661815.1 hypothetical protein L244_30905 [Salmonella enterica subsp. enterica serovar Worthington str. BCH-3194]KAF0786034.1 hypothetical protein L246_11220 [Salmonella enterica subsp. enterica serovar Worthington str. BCH-5715]CBY98699.1 hypothetical protein predicted by 
MNLIKFEIDISLILINKLSLLYGGLLAICFNL